MAGVEWQGDAKRGHARMGLERQAMFCLDRMGLAGLGMAGNARTGAALRGVVRICTARKGLAAPDDSGRPFRFLVRAGARAL